MKNKYMRSLFFTVFTVGVSLIVLTFFNSASDICNDDETVSSPDSVPESPLQIEYGMPVDSFHLIEGVIKRNQFLADILLKHHLSYPEIDKLVKGATDIFDVRKIRAGKKYKIFCSRDSLKKAQCFIYEPNEIDYVVFDLRDSLNIYKGKKEVIKRIKTASGIINSSLYLALQENNVSPVLALKLSEIFAWTVDFYRIQKGDKFKVVYEENVVEGKAIGIGRIRSAVFEHWGEPLYAFYFEQDENMGDYFDEKGQSLRKAFLKAPLKFSRISSGFTRRRFHPVQKRWKAHLGTDYAAPKGTPIMAVGDGKVVEARYKRFNGNYVKIRHNSTYTTQYLHMTKIAGGVKPGKYVKQGDVIGYVGSTGLATGPHVCFRFWKNGSQVDHRKEKFPPSKPVNEDNMKRFMEEMKLMQEQLGEISFTEEKPQV